jgi:hypothetical protein
LLNRLLDGRATTGDVHQVDFNSRVEVLHLSQGMEISRPGDTPHSQVHVRPRREAVLVHQGAEHDDAVGAAALSQ